MSPRPASKFAPEPRNVGSCYWVSALIAVAVGLVTPLLVGSFTQGELLGIGLVEVVCLVVAGSSAMAMTRRLEASRQRFWTLSRRDELTGVGNYRALHERIAEELARHSRRAREFAVVLIDLDGFKQVNERFGHLAGDRMLAEIATALREEVRAEDSAFRQGGDEFAVIAPETNGEEAEEVAARLRHRVRECGNEEMRVSAGTGFAVFPADGRSADELLSVADADLFGAKRGGRAEK
jgi:diguanylate cyclase (GGDEF)-like protein